MTKDQIRIRYEDYLYDISRYGEGHEKIMTWEEFLQEYNDEMYYPSSHINDIGGILNGKIKKKDKVGTNIINIPVPKKAVVKLSDDCLKCKNKCKKGIKYIEFIQSGKIGKGIVCKI